MFAFPLYFSDRVLGRGNTVKTPSQVTLCVYFCQTGWIHHSLIPRPPSPAEGSGDKARYTIAHSLITKYINIYGLTSRTVSFCQEWHEH